MNKIYQYIAHLNSGDRIKAELLKGQVLENQKEISLLKRENELHNIQLKKLIAKQLREEYRELIPSSIVMEANYHFLYIVDENLNFILFENEES